MDGSFDLFRPATCLAALIVYLEFNSALLDTGHTFFFFFLRHPWHMEVPRLGVESELLLPAYPTATATHRAHL